MLSKKQTRQLKTVLEDECQESVRLFCHGDYVCVHGSELAVLRLYRFVMSLDDTKMASAYFSEHANSWKLYYKSTIYCLMNELSDEQKKQNSIFLQFLLEQENQL